MVTWKKPRLHKDTPEAAAAMRKIAGVALTAYGLGVRFSRWVSIPEAPLPANCVEQNAVADEFHDLCKKFFDEALGKGVSNGRQ